MRSGGLIALPVDENQPFGFAHGKRVQDDLVEQRVDRRRGSDSECEREHCRCGE